MTNTALLEARKRAHLSQTEIARQIREWGFKTGRSNGCTRNTYQRWEVGDTRPQPHYLLALEAVLGQPAANLGFAADELGVDSASALADAELGATMPLPDSAAQYGPLTAIWLSTYDYESTSRNATFTSKHYVMLLQRGARLTAKSLPASASKISLDMSVNGQVITGNWWEQTQESGYYSGAVYYGAIQMLLDTTGRRMSGQWVGFGRNMVTKTGPWTLTLVDTAVDQTAVERWNREPE